MKQVSLITPFLWRRSQSTEDPQGQSQRSPQAQPHLLLLHVGGSLVLAASSTLHLLCLLQFGFTDCMQPSPELQATNPPRPPHTIHLGHILSSLATGKSRAAQSRTSPNSPTPNHPDQRYQKFPASSPNSTDSSLCCFPRNPF